MSFEILFWNSFGLHGCKQSSYGFRNWQERQSGGGGDVRGAVLNTTEQGARGGGEDQTTHLPFCSTSISGIGKESIKECKRERKVIMSQLPGTKRRISWRIWPWDELQGCFGKKSSEKKCLLVKRPLILGYKNRQVMAGDRLCAMNSSAFNFWFLLSAQSLTANKIMHWLM